MSCSPELPFDDSDNLLTGSASADVESSPYAGGEPLPVCVEGLAGSSNVTLLLLPEAVLSDMVFLRSFFSSLSFFVTILAGSSGYTSIDDFARPGKRTLDFFLLGFETLISIVGAVVIISGAELFMLARKPSTRTVRSYDEEGEALLVESCCSQHEASLWQITEDRKHVEISTLRIVGVSATRRV
jgi:hypothetical protein